MFLMATLEGPVDFLYSDDDDEMVSMTGPLVVVNQHWDYPCLCFLLLVFMSEPSKLDSELLIW